MSDLSKEVAHFAKRHWMAIALVVVAAIWSFGVNVALQKGFLDDCPNDVCFALLGVPFVALIILGLAHPETRARYYLLHAHKKMTLAIFLAGGAIVGFVLWIFFLTTHPATASTAKNNSEGASGLTMTVQSYRFNDATKELIADVQFINNGTVRRIVLGALFTYKLQNPLSLHYVVDSAEDIHSHGNQAPIYVEPNAPIMVTFRHKLANESPLDTPGTVFGLEVGSVNPKGGGNRTWVEVMEVVERHDDPTKSGGYITDAQKLFSLDVRNENHPMQTQALLRAELGVPTATPIVTPTPAVNTAVKIEISETYFDVGPAQPADSGSEIDALLHVHVVSTDVPRKIRYLELRMSVFDITYVGSPLPANIFEVSRSVRSTTPPFAEEVRNEKVNDIQEIKPRLDPNIGVEGWVCFRVNGGREVIEHPGRRGDLFSRIRMHLTVVDDTGASFSANYQIQQEPTTKIKRVR